MANLRTLQVHGQDVITAAGEDHDRSAPIAAVSPRGGCLSLIPSLRASGAELMVGLPTMSEGIHDSILTDREAL